MVTRALALAVSLAAFSSAAARAEPVFLGIVEPWRAHFADEKSTTAYVVRAAFKYDGGAWSALPSQAEDEVQLHRLSAEYPESLRWQIAFDGKPRESFGSLRPPRWDWYADVGLFQPDPKAPVRLLSDRSRAFNYWEGPSSFRPMIAASSGLSNDPDHWKPSAAAGSELATARAAFRRGAGPVAFVCGGEAAESYPDKDIVVEKAYRSKAGALLLGLRIDRRLLRCDEMDDENWADRWFLVREGAAKEIGVSLALIDAGDYDGDGASEVVFLQSGYDHDGYLLLFDHLNRQAEFGWNYH